VFSNACTSKYVQLRVGTCAILIFRQFCSDCFVELLLNALILTFVTGEVKGYCVMVKQVVLTYLALNKLATTARMASKDVVVHSCK